MRFNVYSLLTLLIVGTSGGCTSPIESPATLAGRWTLESQHVVQTDEVTGQVLHDYQLAGGLGDYLLISANKYEEYSGNQLSYSMPYTLNANTMTLLGPIALFNEFREIQGLTAKKLILRHTTVAFNGRASTIVATYSRSILGLISIK